MKNLYILLAILLIQTSLFSQTDINLNINHLMGSSDFATETSVQNNLGHDFEFGRMEYYISEITLIHDGGQVMMLDDLYLLIDANETINNFLGNYNISVLDSIYFNIGVNEPNNHADPTAFPSDHPLAPQNPSMHWGWAAGYRFVAVEGTCGVDNNFIFEFHGLGDDNYARKTIELAINKTSINGIIDAEINADYLRVLENIDLSSDAISHGEVGDAKKAITNTNNYVFSEVENVLSIGNSLNNFEFKIYPNPSGGYFDIIDLPNNNYEVDFYNNSGKLINTFSGIDNVDGYQINTQGIYFIKISNESGISTQKIIITE